ncbi:MAG: hypothetical protein HRU49_10285 [Winogradskyella sp.]|uniref:PfkB family carbohydrate kinase n=1 Tax=Winogradskyella sp. TaxID=1883156 RepID=UPI0025E6CE53|nr:PfkB family carbohydrate kinase [Winogradskyella sp.]NRB84143.1 hypothetical protein [Winogradskyella sp.]
MYLLLKRKLGCSVKCCPCFQSHGNAVSMINAVGKDKNGQEILDDINDSNIDTSLIQVIANQLTSLVKVHLDENGSASYSVEMPCA